MKRRAKVGGKSCVACGACAEACPRGAVEIYRGCRAVVAAGACVGCGLCEKSCPTGAIKVEAANE